MRKNFVLVIFIGLLMATGYETAVARFPETPPEQPNLYEFAGRGFSISYSTSSIGGEALLHYRQRQFKGDEIRLDRTEIGQLVTVTLWQISDLKTVTLTLLIPTINLDGRGPNLFETTATITSHHTTIAGPDLVQGPIQTYRTLKLFGQASSVDFLEAGMPGVFGKVTQSPTCPGPQQPGQSCIGPLSGVSVQILDDLDQIIGTAVTDNRGLFAVRAEAGNYTVNIDIDGIFPACPQTPIAVPDRIVPVRINCDTGIR